MENKTQNILTINAIYSEPIKDPFFRKYVVSMKAVLSMNCRPSGTTPIRIEITSKSQEVSTPTEGLRQAIENFLNGRSEFDVQNFKVQPESSSLPHTGINDVRVELDEPLKTEFENIFNASNWQNVQLKIN